MKKILLTVLLGLGILSLTGCGDKKSEGFSKSISKSGISVKYSSAKPLVVGNNTIDVLVKQGGAVLNGAHVVFKIYMPEMPGMPYMEDAITMSEKDGHYQGEANFSMGGTWQVVIFVEKDGKKYKIESSVNL